MGVIMLIGLDENDNRISAKDALRKGEYKCPICNERVELRKGEVRIPHFAHWKKSTCLDTWSHDMSEWHYMWQDKFPTNCQEVVVENEGKKHRADVLISDHNLVIEFQHSRLSAEEFQERNSFYNNCGYHVVWLFDMSEFFNEDKLILDEDEKAYHWKRPLATFQNTYSIVYKLYRECDVFFENNGFIERILKYDFENKYVQTSATDPDEYFVWSKNTFEIWLKKTCHVEYLREPKCAKCYKYMVLRQTSWGKWIWGCQNYRGKEKDCREMIHIGDLPINVNGDNQCPYCDGNMIYDLERIRCKRCDYSIRVKLFH